MRPTSSPKPRKPHHTPAAIDRLTPAQREKVKRWFLSQPELTYAKAAARIRARFHHIIRPAVLCRYWQRECAPVLAQRAGQNPDTFRKPHRFAGRLADFTPVELEQIKRWYLDNPNLTHRAAIARGQKQFGKRLTYHAAARLWQLYVSPSILPVEMPPSAEIIISIRHGQTTLQGTAAVTLTPPHA